MHLTKPSLVHSPYSVLVHAQKSKDQPRPVSDMSTYCGGRCGGTVTAVATTYVTLTVQLHTVPYQYVVRQAGTSASLQMAAALEIQEDVTGDVPDERERWLPSLIHRHAARLLLRLRIVPPACILLSFLLFLARREACLGRSVAIRVDCLCEANELIGRSLERRIGERTGEIHHSLIWRQRDP